MGLVDLLKSFSAMVDVLLAHYTVISIWSPYQLLRGMVTKVLNLPMAPYS